MSQMISAVLALLLVTLVAFNQQRGELFVRGRLIDDEVEVTASGVALQVLELIGTKRFDQAEGAGYIATTSLLRTSFPTGQRCDVTAPFQTASPYTDCDDIEDFNAMAWEPLPFVVGPDTLWFKVSAEVTYVDAAQQPTTTRTFAKRVTVLVRDSVRTGANPLLRLPVRLPRVFSYPD